MGGGGGGQQGRVIVPQYQGEIHGQFIAGRGIDGDNVYTIASGEAHPFAMDANYTMTAIVSTLLSTDSPYSDANLDPDGSPVWEYDPTTDLGNIDTRITAALAKMSITPGTTISGMLTAAIAAVDASDAVDDDFIDDTVSAYEAESRTEYLQSVGRFAASIADIGAVSSTAFIWGMADMEGRRSRDLSTFRQKVKLAREDNRQRLIANHIQQNLALQMAQVDWYRSLVGMEMDNSRVAITAMNDYYNLVIDHNVKDTLWDMEIFRSAGNFIASVQGGVAHNDKEGNKIVSGVAGMAVGAAAGGYMAANFTAAGAAAGPIGMAVGAGVGLLAGLLQ